MIKNNIKFRANLMLFQLISIGIVLFATITYVIITILPKILIVYKSLLGQLETVCGCSTHLSFTNHPVIFSGIILLSTIVFLYISFVGYRFCKLNISTHRFINAALRQQKGTISKKLELLANKLKIGKNIVETNDKRLIIFCYGYLNPKICISTAIINILTMEELRAVLLHEKQHIVFRDPLKLFVIKLLSGIMFFIPGTQYLHDQYKIYSELHADSLATKNFTSKQSLAQALSKILTNKVLLKKNLALSFFSNNTNNTIEERINKLTNTKYSPKTIYVLPRFVGIMLVIAMVIMVANYFYSNSNIAKANEITISCINMQQQKVDKKRSCEHIKYLQKNNCQNVYYSPKENRNDEN